MKRVMVLAFVLICIGGLMGCSRGSETSGSEQEASPDPGMAGEKGVPVDDIMGMPGFYTVNENEHSTIYNYYVMVGENAVKVAESWGDSNGENSNEESCFSVDLEGDGIPEMVCNVTYSDGARATMVYRREGAVVYRGFADDLLDEKYDNLHYMSTYSYYLPEEEMVEIFYWIEKDNGYKSKKYVIDPDKILYWETFAELEN